MQPSQPQNKKIIGITTFAAIAYGVIHDQVTAHLCVEYFTVAHPPLFHTQSPTILALCWGITATVGVGAVLGVILAEVSQSEGLAPYPVARLVRSIFILLATMALIAFLAGVLGFELSRHAVLFLPISLAELIPADRRDAFMAVWFAHAANYLVGLAGGAFLSLRIWRQRGKPRVLALLPQTRPAVIRALILAALILLIMYVRFAHSMQ